MDDIKELQDLNYEEAKQYIGGVVFVSIIKITTEIELPVNCNYCQYQGRWYGNEVVDES
jgi:hypothetical protein